MQKEIFNIYFDFPQRFHYLLTPYLDSVANCEGAAYNDVRVNGGVVGVHV
jgi:hypothetical protein